jgi:GNAT superfamily N-acetyltransferase
MPNRPSSRRSPKRVGDHRRPPLRPRLGCIESVNDALAEIRFTWRGEVTDDELVTLSESYGGQSEHGWWAQIRSHSLGWVAARTPDSMLIGFVNVAWDGGDHAFLIDTKVHRDHWRRGIGTELVRVAVQNARKAGCEWLEVDFEAHLASFYYDACGFKPTLAGLIHLPDFDPDP